ncbi:hypothetical protein BSLG_005180 [Batrachochytrium salamandrivorans]|nr:hypothetical protein BASA81_015488 [Batrachochytrium salamandrivorans]KAJ1340187.1 hypothetical protein BSLG_005180 [Batrachochytrium salamandrivorans]
MLQASRHDDEASETGASSKASQMGGIKNRILLIGTDTNSDRIDLVKETLHSLAGTSHEMTSGVESWQDLALLYPPSSTMVAAHTEPLVYFQIHTKYYHAEVVFQLDDQYKLICKALEDKVDGDADTEKDTPTQKCLEHAEDTAPMPISPVSMSNVDAILYLVCETETMDQIRKTLAWMETAITDNDISVAMMVVPESAINTPGNHADLEALCMDAGIELVDWQPRAAMQDPVSSEAAPRNNLVNLSHKSLLNEDGGTDEELTGASRIAEALTLNIWDGMTRKTSQTQDPQPDEEFGDYTMADIDDMGQHLFGDIDTDDGFEKTLQALQTLRSQGQNMPDADRRALAEKVALAFQLHLGADSDEEEDCEAN